MDYCAFIYIYILYFMFVFSFSWRFTYLWVSSVFHGDVQKCVCHLSEKGKKSCTLYVQQKILMMSIVFVQIWEKNAKFVYKMSLYMRWAWIRSGLLDLSSGGPYTTSSWNFNPVCFVALFLKQGRVTSKNQNYGTSYFLDYLQSVVMLLDIVKNVQFYAFSMLLVSSKRVTSVIVQPWFICF